MTSPFAPGDSVVAYLRDSGHEDQDLSIPADQPGMVEDPAHAKVHFGKNQGKTLGELLQTEDGRSWVEWLVEKFTPRDSQGTALQRSAKVLLMMRQRA